MVLLLILAAIVFDRWANNHRETKTTVNADLERLEAMSKAMREQLANLQKEVYVDARIIPYNGSRRGLEMDH